MRGFSSRQPWSMLPQVVLKALTLLCSLKTAPLLPKCWLFCWVFPFPVGEPFSFLASCEILKESFAVSLLPFTSFPPFGFRGVSLMFPVWHLFSSRHFYHPCYCCPELESLWLNFWWLTSQCLCPLWIRPTPFFSPRVERTIIHPYLGTVIQLHFATNYYLFVTFPNFLLSPTLTWLAIARSSHHQGV